MIAFTEICHALMLTGFLPHDTPVEDEDAPGSYFRSEERF